MSETPEEVAERRESLVRLLRLYDSFLEQPTEHELRSGCRDAADALEDEMRRAKAAEERARKAEEERDEARRRRWNLQHSSELVHRKWDEARAEIERLRGIIAAVPTNLIRSYPEWLTAIAAEQQRIRAEREDGA